MTNYPHRSARVLKALFSNCLLLILEVRALSAVAGVPVITSDHHLFEWTVESLKSYADPFNDVDVDAIFTKEGQSWRVPMFWRGGQQWTVRFSPPSSGEYTYHLESTDPSNSDLNGHKGYIKITAYSGGNDLLRHGMLRVASNRRYFEHVDGTPFYWLGDTWWTGLSNRLDWKGFQELTADRRVKGFTVIQIVGGLIPSNEELAPVDPGFCNEGGCAWDPDFGHINPGYFDAADRRIQYLVANGLVPAIVGGWRRVLPQMGVAKMKQHWRYLIARYGCYPVFWIVGGEVFDPPEHVLRRLESSGAKKRWLDVPAGSWSSVARYLRESDPYHHPVTVHEVSPDDLPLQEEELTDFKLIQPSHYGWASIGVEVAQITAHYARHAVVKPIVQGEIGYEKLGEMHFEDFQRVAFWLAMLNGAAGHTYGANGTWEAYGGDKLLHRWRHSFMSWDEGMRLPGSYQVGIGAKLLREYAWWRFAPHPEWIFPRGTTLFEPRADAPNHFELNLSKEADPVPSGDWTMRHGNFRLPYAAGIPREVRFIYIPPVGIIPPSPPTIFALEARVRYRAFYWEPTTGTRIDLGIIERPAPGKVIFEDPFQRKNNPWAYSSPKATAKNGALIVSGTLLAVAPSLGRENLVVSVDARNDSDAGLLLRYQDAENYAAAMYSPAEKSLYVVERIEGRDSGRLGQTAVPDIGKTIRLTSEIRNGFAIASVSDGHQIYTTPIVRVSSTGSGSAGILHSEPTTQMFDNFEIRESPALVTDTYLERKLYDAKGQYRGELRGAAMSQGPIQEYSPGNQGWDDYGRHKNILLDAYLPERLPTAGDWLLVLDAQNTNK